MRTWQSFVFFVVLGIRGFNYLKILPLITNPCVSLTILMLIFMICELPNVRIFQGYCMRYPSLFRVCDNGLKLDCESALLMWLYWASFPRLLETHSCIFRWIQATSSAIQVSYKYFLLDYSTLLFV
jgi:hypothetical protein